MTRSPRLLSLVVFAVSAATLPASARPTKVALCQIEGDTTGMAKAVAGALDDTELEVVAGKPVARALDRLGLDAPLGDRDIGKLAAELEVDAVVKGTFDRRSHKLWFTIFTGGKKGKPFPVAAGNTSSDRFRKLVRTTLVAKVASIVPARSAEDGDEDRPARGKATDDNRAARGKPRGRQRSGDEVADAADAAQGDDAGDDRPATGKPRARPKTDVAEDARPRTKAKAKPGDEAAEDKPARTKAKAKPGDEVAQDKPARAKAKAKAKPDDEVAEDKPARTKAKAKPDDEATEDKPARTKAKAKPDDEVAEDKPARAKAKAKPDDEVAEDKPAKAKAKPDDEVAEDKPARAKPKAKPDDEVADAGTPRTGSTRVAARDDDAAAPSAEARFEPSSPAVHGLNLAAVRVDLGASMSARSLRFQSRAFAGAPGSYTNKPVPGGRVEAELYPYALVDPSSLLAGFGVAADYDQVISLTLRASGEMTVPLKTTERRYSFGVRYRLAFGRRPTSPTLTLGVGYAARTFMVERKGLMSASSLDLPDVDYRMVDPGLSFRMPLGERFAVTLAGRGLLLTSAGAIQRLDQYGTTKIVAGTASVGAELVVTSRIAVRLAAEATQLNLKFAGNGALANSRDGEASSVDVRSATDRYYGGIATVAVTY